MVSSLSPGEILLGIEPSKPACPEIRQSAFPQDLRSLRQWVGYVLPSKEPINPMTGKGARSNDPSTWGSINEAVDAVLTWGLAGMGFMLRWTKQTPYVVVDFDHCRNSETGEIDPAVWRDVCRLRSWTEVSVSGTGLHVFCRGTKPGEKSKGGSCEMYSTGRYIAMTGNWVVGSMPVILPCSRELTELYTKRIDPPREIPKPAHRQPSRVVPPADEDLLEQIERSKLGPKFRRLWAGVCTDYIDPLTGKPDRSRADFGLVGILSRFTGDDAPRIDRLYRRSGLFRSKWDEHRGQFTYGDITIERALKKGK